MAPGQRLLPGQADGGRVRHAAIAARLLYEELVPAHGLRLLLVRSTSSQATGSRRGLSRGANRSPRRRSSSARGGRCSGAVRAPGRWRARSRARPPAHADRRSRLRARDGRDAARHAAAAARRAAAGDTWSAASTAAARGSSRRTHPGRAGSRGALHRRALLGLVLAAVCAWRSTSRSPGSLIGGQVLLAFAVALDACARALGAIAAGKVGSPGLGVGVRDRRQPGGAGFALFQSARAR